jgi:hypothetical protein
MAFGSGIDRNRLTRAGRYRGPTAFLVAAAVLLVALGSLWLFFLSQDDPTPVVAATTTVATTNPTSTTASPEETTTTRAAVTETSVVAGRVSEIPVLTEAEAYQGAQARLQWLAGSTTGWIVDMADRTAARFEDLPNGAWGGGTPMRDGSLIVEVDGRILRRSPDGEWTDLSPQLDRSYRIVDTRTGGDHVHIYLVESGGPTDRLVNVQFNYPDPDTLDVKWAIDRSGVVRVSASKAAQLVIVELAPPNPEDAPDYLLLREGTGRSIRASAFPDSSPPSTYVWGLEFLEGGDVFYMRCADAETFAACGVSSGEIVNLTTRVVTPVRDVYPGWSTEWENRDGAPSFARMYGDLVLLVRTNVDLADLQTGDRLRLIPARDL